jgi:diguanylate cyclase (GGDEF)-like protein
MSTVRRQPATSSTRRAESLPPLLWVLNQSAQIEAKVEACAEEISSISAVLRRKLSPRLDSREAEQALSQSEHVRHTIEQCAEELHSLNAAVAQEIKERRKSERALAGMQVRLIGTQNDLMEIRSELMRVNDEREKARYFAFHDSLTGLANPNLFNDRLEHALAYAKRYARPLVVMCIDIDRFKSINESHSRYIGDKVLQSIAQRLLSSMRATDTLGRQEDDQFFVLLEELASRDSIEPIVRKLMRMLAQPFEIEGATIAITASIGIAVYPDDGETAEALINNADAAMYEARESASRYAFYNPRFS